MWSVSITTTTTPNSQMNSVWIVLLALSFLLAIALIVFYEYYVYQPGTDLSSRAPNADVRGGGWATVVASLGLLLVLGLWIGFAITYYQARKRVVPVVCQPDCFSTTSPVCMTSTVPEPSPSDDTIVVDDRTDFYTITTV